MYENSVHFLQMEHFLRTVSIHCCESQYRQMEYENSYVGDEELVADTKTLIHSNG